MSERNKLERESSKKGNKNSIEEVQKALITAERAVADEEASCLSFLISSKGFEKSLEKSKKSFLITAA